MIDTAAAYVNDREVGESISTSGINHDPDTKFDSLTGVSNRHVATPSDKLVA
jgi:hypothetical protein